MATKSLALLFLIITILNIPVYAFYYSGNITKISSGGETKQAFSYSDYFAMLSLGNIGQSQNACAETNIAFEKEMVMACSYGHLAQFESFGLSKDDDSICTTLSVAEQDDTPLFMDSDCYVGKGSNLY